LCVCSGCCLELFLSDHDIERLHDFEEECMEIYYREKESKIKATIEQQMKLNAERFVIDYAIYRKEKSLGKASL